MDDCDEDKGVDHECCFEAEDDICPHDDFGDEDEEYKEEDNDKRYYPLFDKVDYKVYKEKDVFLVLKDY
jgi:hypothetical protein